MVNAITSETNNLDISKGNFYNDLLSLSGISQTIPEPISEAEKLEILLSEAHHKTTKTNKQNYNYVSSNYIDIIHFAGLNLMKKAFR